MNCRDVLNRSTLWRNEIRNGEDARKVKKRAHELDFPDALLIRLGREFQGSGECRYGSARGNIFAERHYGDDPGRTIDPTKNTNGGKQRLPFLKLDLLCVIPPVKFGLSACIRRMGDFGSLSGDAT
jgi:hypothetical protein